MTQGTNQAARTASVRPARHVSYTDHGDLVVRVPATLLELATVVAMLVALAAVPFAFAGLLAVVPSMPLAFLALTVLLAAALVAPFAGLSLLAGRLG